MSFKVVHIEETDSTNLWMKAYGEGEMVVVADYQTAGKGCGSNSWESERGRNLLFSVLIHPADMRADCQFRISEAVSLALCETLDSYLCQKVEIKWPNDIYVDDRKICGILIENRLKGRLMTDSVIGIGLNVNQQVFRSDAPNPVSMWQLLGHEVDRERLLQTFLEKLTPALQMEPEALEQAYKMRLYRREGEWEFRDSKGQFRARLLNVLDDGRIVLLDTGGTARIYAFKEVVFIV